MRDITMSNFNFAYPEDRARLIESPALYISYFKVGKGFATIGGVKVGRKFYYAVALCSPKDNFSKRRGRWWLKENMLDEVKSQKRGCVDLADFPNLPPTQLLKEVLEHFLSKRGKNFPRWIKNSKVDFRKKFKVKGNGFNHSKDYNNIIVNVKGRFEKLRQIAELAKELNVPVDLPDDYKG